jgi:hypothetical protein
MLTRRLLPRCDELMGRINRRLVDVYVEREPDDAAALASDSARKDMAVATIGRERRTSNRLKWHSRRSRRATMADACLAGKPSPMPASKLSRGIESVCAAPSAFRVTLVWWRTNYAVLFPARASCFCHRTLFHRVVGLEPDEFDSDLCSRSCNAARTVLCVWAISDGRPYRDTWGFNRGIGRNVLNGECALRGPL